MVLFRKYTENKMDSILSFIHVSNKRLASACGRPRVTVFVTSNMRIAPPSPTARRRHDGSTRVERTTAQRRVRTELPLDEDPVLGSAIAALLLARLHLFRTRTARGASSASSLAPGLRRSSARATPAARTRCQRAQSLVHAHRLRTTQQMGLVHFLLLTTN